MSGKIPCISNLKRMWLATEMYAGDNSSHYPPVDAWMDKLLTYSETENPYHDLLAVGKPTYGYAFREKASASAEASIRNPSKLILIFDSELDGRSRHSELWSMPQGGRHSRTGADGDPTTDYTIMADGHVKSLYVHAEPGMKSSLQLALLDDDQLTWISR